MNDDDDEQQIDYNDIEADIKESRMEYEMWMSYEAQKVRKASMILESDIKCLSVYDTICKIE